MIENYFPWGIAKGDAFFDREKETARLLDNIKLGRHTLLLSPRRYGKTSLAKYVVSKANVPCVDFDLFLILDAKSVEFKFLKAVQVLINQVSETPEQWFRALRDYFTKAKKKWTIGIKGVSLELTPEENHYTPDNILDALSALEHILAKKQQRAVMFIDEFQEIGKLKEGSAIEGAIRNFAQSSTYLTFIFSGSDRHTLEDMFGDSERPLYKLCDRINLGLIPEHYYRNYLNNVSNITWNEEISDDAFSLIMKFTKGHPHNIYVLCSYIWRNYPKKAPTAQEAQECWEEYINDLLKETRTDLKKLSTGQLKVLILVAMEVRELTGKDNQRRLNLTSSAIVQAIKVLEESDYIQKINTHAYAIINPVIKHTLIMFYKDY